MNLTEKELKLLKFIVNNASSFNFCKINLSKTWEENKEHLESEIFEDIVNLKKYNNLLNTNNAGSRAILGSLHKKNLIKVSKDDFSNDSWIIIDEDQFNNIKQILK